MIFVGPTLLILSLLALNHAIHGPACLGLQPGGESTANLFWLQVLVSLTACCWGAYRSLRRENCHGQALTALAFFVAAIALIEYGRSGWRLLTSIHNQTSVENLPTFLLTATPALLLGVQKWREDFRWSLRSRARS